MALAAMLLALAFALAPAEARAEPAAAAPATGTGTATAKALAPDVLDYAPLEILLGKYVDARGEVDYARWHQNQADRLALGAFIERVGSARLDRQAPKARLAFYLNAYNALVLHAIVERWPVESVMKLPGFFKTARYRVAGESMTLDELEHARVRPQFLEPRIHFVLVCGAKSCPRLRRDALRAATLEAVLESATREFVQASTRFEGSNASRVQVSTLFEWFREDFDKAAGTVPAFLARYLRAEQAERLRSGAMTLSYTPYDWSVNAP